jgi:hypothetical protein
VLDDVGGLQLSDVDDELLPLREHTPRRQGDMVQARRIHRGTEERRRCAVAEGGVRRQHLSQEPERLGVVDGVIELHHEVVRQAHEPWATQPATGQAGGSRGGERVRRRQLHVPTLRPLGAGRWPSSTSVDVLRPCGSAIAQLIIGEWLRDTPPKAATRR